MTTNQLSHRGLVHQLGGQAFIASYEIEQLLGDVHEQLTHMPS